MNEKSRKSKQGSCCCDCTSRRLRRRRRRSKWWNRKSRARNLQTMTTTRHNDDKPNSLILRIWRTSRKRKRRNTTKAPWLQYYLKKSRMTQRQKSQQRGAHHDLGRYVPRRPPKNCKKQNRGKKKAATETLGQQRRQWRTSAARGRSEWITPPFWRSFVCFIARISRSLCENLALASWTQRKEGFDDVDERRMTKKDALCLCLCLSVVSFELGFFIERGLDSGGESSWSLIFGEAIPAQFISWFFFFPCLFSDLPSFRRDVCFSWICIVISGMCFSYVGGWKSY